MTNPNRWKQRFQNFEKAYIFLEESCKHTEFSKLEASGLVQVFEFTFERAWKTLKDYLEFKGLNVSFPRDVIKESFANGLISDGHIWLEMLEKRNQLSHTYNEVIAADAVNVIKDSYFVAISQVFTTLNTLLKE